MASAIDELLKLPGDLGDAVRTGYDNAPLPGEMPADTERRLGNQAAVASQVAGQVAKLQKDDYTQRQIPFFTDESGKVRPVTDSTGAALTQFDKPHGIAYDSTGAPQKITYGETGPPKLVDPYATAPITTDTEGNQYKAPPGLAWKQVGTDPTVIAKKIKGRDLAQRSIPTYLDEQGQVQAVNDPKTGKPLTNFDKPNNIAYDSEGKAVQLNFGPSGPPAVEDAMKGVPVTTDEKTGAQYRIRRGLPWENVGTDPEIEAKNLEAAKQAAVAKASVDMGRKLTLDERQLHRDQADYDHQKKQLMANVPDLQAHDGEDFDSLHKVIEDSFNKQYALPEANDTKGWFGGDLTPEAKAIRAGLDARKAKAMQALDNLANLKTQISARAEHVETTQAQNDALMSQRVNADLAKAKAAGVNVPGMEDVKTATAQPEVSTEQQGPPAPVAQSPGSLKVEPGPHKPDDAGAGPAPDPVAAQPPQSETGEMMDRIMGSGTNHWLATITGNAKPSEAGSSGGPALASIADAADKLGPDKFGKMVDESVARGEISPQLAAMMKKGAADMDAAKPHATPWERVKNFTGNTIGAAASGIGEMLRGPLGQAYVELAQAGTGGGALMDDKAKYGDMATKMGVDMEKIPGVVTNPAFKENGEAKAGRFVGGAAPWIAQASTVPELTFPMLFSSGYQGQVDAATKAGADEETAQKAGLIGGAVNMVLGIPFKNAGRVIVGMFGKASAPVVEQAFTKAYEEGGAVGVAKLLTAWRSAFESASPGLVESGGQATAQAAKDQAFQAAAVRGMQGVISEINSTIAQRAGRVAATAARDAAVFGGVQAGQNIVAQQTYDPNRKVSEGVLEQAVGGLAMGSLFGTLGQVQAAKRAGTEREAFATELAKPANARDVTPPPDTGTAGSGGKPPAGPQPPAGPAPGAPPAAPAPETPPAQPAPSGGKGKPSPTGGAPVAPGAQTPAPAPGSPAPPVEGKAPSGTPGAPATPSPSSTPPEALPPAPDGSGTAAPTPKPPGPAGGGGNAPTETPPQIQEEPPAASKEGGSSKEPTTPPEPPATVDQGAHDAATSPQNELTEPTTPQKEAGNYKVGRVRLSGLDISIENPAGSYRYKIDSERLKQVADKFSGVSQPAADAISGAIAKIHSGDPEAGFDTLRNVQRNTYQQHPALSDVIGEVLDQGHANKMQAHYGYIRGSKGKDGDHIDVFIKPGTPLDYQGPVFVVNQTTRDGKTFDEHKAIIGVATKEEAHKLYLSNYHKDWKGGGDVATFSSMDSFKQWATGASRRTAKAKGDNGKIAEHPDGKEAANTARDWLKQQDKNGKKIGRYVDALSKISKLRVDSSVENDLLGLLREAGIENTPNATFDGQQAFDKFWDDFKAEMDRAPSKPADTAAIEKLRDQIAEAQAEIDFNDDEGDQEGANPALKARIQKLREDLAKLSPNENQATPAKDAATDIEESVEGNDRPPKPGKTGSGGSSAPAPGAKQPDTHPDFSKPDVAKAAIKASLDRYAERFQSLDVTVRPRKDGDPELGAGIAIDPETFEIIHDADRQAKLMAALHAKGADAAAWQEHAVDEEHEHSLDILVSGHDFGKWHASIMDSVPDFIRTGLELVYPESLSMKGQGVELIRMLAQIATRGTITESFIPGRPAAELITALKAWDLPEPIAAHLLAMARLRNIVAAGESPWPAPTPVPSESSGTPALKLARQVSQALAKGPLDRRALTEMAKGSGLSQKQVDEAAELGVVLTARDIIARVESFGEKPENVFRMLARLYERQPNLTAKTSTSKVNQAYSTPVPLAWATGMRIGMADAKTAADDTAGNGALTLAAKPANTVVNEIDPQRAENLQQLGFKQVTRNDATAITSQADRKNLNPPFGTQLEGGSKKSWPLYTSESGLEVETPNIDMAIVAKSLSGLTKDGKASIIMGGKMGNQDERAAGYAVRDTQLPFWHWLYKNFNVTDHFTVSGDLYAKQGARWPVDVIIVEGKGEESSLPKPWMTAPPVLDTWEKVGDRLLSHEQSVSQTSKPGSKPPVQQPGRPSGGGDVVGPKPPKSGPAKQKPAGGGVNPPAVAGGKSGLGDSGGNPPAGPKGGSGKPAGGSVQPPKPDSAPKLTDEQQKLKDASGDLFGASNPLVPSRRGRIAELEQAARDLKDGKIDRAEYDARVQSLKPVAPLTKLPEVPSDEAMKDALTSEKSPLVGAARSLPAGTPVGLRIDIPAFKKTGAYVVTIHEQASAGKVGKRIGYDGVASVSNPKFFVTSQDLSQKIATGEVAKAPLATVEGDFLPSRTVPPSTINQTQVSYDPERHGYFYDRENGRPVIGGKSATLVGNTVFVTGPVYGDAGKFLYASDPEERNYDTPIPPERMAGMLPAVLSLAAKADTPEKFAEAVIPLGPKAPNYIQALWFGAKMGGAKGPDRPDWPSIFKAMEPTKEPEPKTEEPPEHKLETDDIVDLENAFQSSYTPRSKSPLLNKTLVPVNLRDEIETALNDLEARRGNIDEFAASQMRWLSGGIPEMHGVLDGGQVDAFALAIDKVMLGKALITGDQTGMGKGRVAAAILTWAQQEGHIPVFFTAGDALYLPMLEDFRDIHAPHMVPLMTNNDAKVVDSYGDVAMRSLSAEKNRVVMRGIISSGRLPVGKNVLFTTYDQLKSDKPQGYREDPRGKRQRKANRIPVPDGLRTQMLRSIADKAVFILDESHKAAGNSDTGFRLMQMLMGWDIQNRPVENSKPVGAYYSSATFSKRPDNMPIYAMTDLGKAVSDPRTLPRIFDRGGIAMMQVASAMLARAGQYIRREMDFSGVNFINHMVGDAPTAANPYPEQYRQADAFTAPLRDIIDFSQRVAPLIAEINKLLRADGVMVEGKLLADQLQGVNFADQIHNMVSQYLLAVKAKATGEEAVRQLSTGKKPVITVQNTLEKPYKETIALGFKPNFQGLLQRYLKKALDVTRKKADGTKVKEAINLDEYKDNPNPRIRQLAEELQDMFDTHTGTILAADIKDLHISPLDTIKEAIEAAGYTAGEITGRTVGIRTDGKQYKREAIDKKAAGKNRILSKFVNAGKDGEQGFDAMILNEAGSTGISAHAAEKFYDKRPRVMLIAQPNSDISIMMQMYGRIFRKGQLSLPEYLHLLSQIAAELRLASVLSRKLKSLKANTTSNTSGSEMTDMSDLFNNYGDIASYITLESHPEIVRMLVNKFPGALLPPRFDPDGTDLIRKSGGFYAKVSGETNILPAEWQNIFYSEADAEWKAIVQEADEMGTNELKVDAMDLKARTMDTEIIAPEVGDTEFESAAHLETVETKAGREPIPHAEVMKIHAENTEPVKEATKNWGLDFDNAKAARINDLREKQGHLENWPAIEQQAESRMNRDKGIISDAFRMFGRGVTVDMDGIIATGVVTNVKPDLDNPLLPSRQKITVHINTSKRTITLAATQARRLLTETSLEEAQLRYDSTVNRSTRRHIVTGNIIAGWDALTNQNAEGKIITFTADDGTGKTKVRTGILLPLNYNPGAAMAKVKTLAQLETAIGHGYEVRTPSGLSIRNTGGYLTAQTVEIRAPSARNRGGRYWREAAFNRLLQGGEMRQQGADMVGTMTKANLTGLIAFVHDIAKEQLSYTIPPRAQQGASNPLIGASNPLAALKKTQKAMTPFLDAGKDVAGGIVGVFAPSMKSHEHLAAANTLRSVLGPMHRTQEAWAEQLKHAKAAPWWKFEKLGVGREGLPIDKNPGLKFMSDRSMGRAMDPEMQPIADQFTKMETQLLAELKSAGADMQNVRENYQKGAWTPESRRAFNAAMEEAEKSGIIPRDYDVNTGTPLQMAAIKDLTDKFLADGKGTNESATAYLARRPLKGGESFRKAKVFQEDWIRAVQHGLVSFSNNPVDVEMLLLSEMARSIMGNRALRKFEAHGDVTTEEGLFQPPDDSYVKLADKYGEMWGGNNVPVWKVMRELAKSTKRDLFYVGFGRDIFADPVLKDEINDLRWEVPAAGGGMKEINIHAMHTGTGRSYSQLVIEKMLEDHDAFEAQAPQVYAKLEGIANNNTRLRQILDTPTFADLGQRLPVGGRVLKGYRYAKRPVADVLNNYLSSSIYNSPAFGTLYKGWMALASSLNQMQLGAGLSAFHAAFTMAEVQMSGIANVIQDIYGVARGNRSMGDLMQSAKMATIAMGETAMTGDKVLNAWREPDGVINPRIMQVVEALQLAGAGFTMERGMQTDQFHKMVSDVFNDRKVMAAARSPVAAMELMGHWIMKGLVPRQKAGIFAHMVWRLIETNPGTPLADLAPQINAAWNDVDQRLGQVRYDRIFMHNIAKNMIQGAIRAPGWSGGTIAQLGGAVGDAYGFFHQWAKEKKMPDDIPPKVAYTMALLMLSCTLCAAATYLFTGTKPEGMDYWAFRTGGTDEHGNPERFVLPTYAKDLFAYSTDTKQTLINKLHPALSLFAELYKNKDYYGVQIAPEDDTALKKLYARGKYVAQAFEPFWSRGLRREHDRSGMTGKMLLPMVGVMPAPKSMTQSPAERKADEYAQESQQVGGRTQAQADASKARAKIVEQLRRRQTPDFAAAIKAGYIKTGDIQGLQQRASITPLQYQVKKLELDKAEAVYRLATPKEKAQLDPIMATKRRNKLEAAGAFHKSDSTLFKGF